MSSILKALKKLETENALRHHDPLKIDAEILRDSTASRVSSAKAILAAAFLFVCGSGVTYLYMKQGQKTPHHAPTNAAPSPASKTTALPPPRPISVSVPVERIKPEPIVAATTEPDMKITSRNTSQRNAVPQMSSRQAPESSQVLRIQSKQMGPLHQNLAEKKLQPGANKQKTISGTHAATSLQIPALRVNGIAFQDGSDSVAVVNGVPVSRGSTIEGVKVDEIQRDRILFSCGGERFTIQLGKSNR